MNKQLLDRINKNLYDVENIVSTPSIIKQFNSLDTDIREFDKVIEVYINNSHLLKKVDNDSLLKLLDEKLLFIIRHIHNLSLYRTEIEVSINFIIKKVDIFFHLPRDNNSQNIDKNEKISTINMINVKNFFSIKDVKLNNLKDKKEIYIVGENGDGKTLILQAIAVGIKGVNRGAVLDLLEFQKNYEIEVFNSNNESKQLSNNMFAYGSSRNNNCNAEEDETGFLTLFNSKTFNVTLKDAEQWLIYLDHKDNQLLISMVKLTLKRVLGDEVETHITPDEVLFTERGAKDISFKQLSAGYRSVITLICDLIEKLSNSQPYISNIKEYQGIVLIDELELHLHPKWQYSFMNNLRETFPLIQFIVTTHSPIVLLGAGMEAVYYQIYKKDGVVSISEQKEVKSDYINDIQSSIFGFDVNWERINNPTNDDNKRQAKSKENLLQFINNLNKEE